MSHDYKSESGWKRKSEMRKRIDKILCAKKKRKKRAVYRSKTRNNLNSLNLKILAMPNSLTTSYTVA